MKFLRTTRNYIFLSKLEDNFQTIKLYANQITRVNTFKATSAFKSIIIPVLILLVCFPAGVH